MPNWPANDRPSLAQVVWDSRGLRILASNSSLAQILKEVSVKTGATLEGLGDDQRIFGSYGPGTAHDVLSQLLDGSGYNVLLIGDQGQGTPRRIVLSARSNKGAPSPGIHPQPATDQEDNDADQPDQPDAEQPQPSAPAPSMPIRAQPQAMQQHQQQFPPDQMNPQN